MIPYKDLHPSKSFPVVTVLLIAANVAVFAYEIFLPAAADRFIYRYAVIPYEFKLGHNISISPGPFPLFSIFTALFLHGGWFHIIGNMLYLWIFGNNVEDRMGRIRFLLFYLLCGLTAAIAQIYADFDSRLPTLGASGAIAGVLGAYLRLFPKARIAVLVPIFYFLRTVILQILEVQFSRAGTAGGVAYFAHIGGFISGILFLPLFLKKGKR